MILSFICADTEALYEGKPVQKFSSIKTVAVRKLQMLDNASTLGFLRSPPGNRLELLRGARGGQHSIRVNQQWRLCFVWTDSGPKDVEIVDYH